MRKTKLHYTFKGKFIEAVLANHKACFADSKGNMYEEFVPIQGIVLDEDDDYLYLGNKDQNPCMAIMKVDTIFIKEIQPKGLKVIKKEIHGTT